MIGYVIGALAFLGLAKHTPKRRVARVGQGEEDFDIDPEEVEKYREGHSYAKEWLQGQITKVAREIGSSPRRVAIVFCMDNNIALIDTATDLQDWRRLVSYYLSRSVTDDYNYRDRKRVIQYGLTPRVLGEKVKWFARFLDGQGEATIEYVKKNYPRFFWTKRADEFFKENLLSLPDIMYKSQDEIEAEEDEERKKKHDEKAKEEYHRLIEELEASKFREAFYGAEADKAWAEREKKEAEIRIAVERAKSDAKKIANMMADIEEDKEDDDEWDWPEWLGVGFVAGGAALLIGPEILAAMAARVGTAWVMDTVASVAARWGIARVAISLEEMEAAVISTRAIVARGEILSAEGAALRAEAELSSLISRLKAADFDVLINKSVEVSVKIGL